MTGLHTPGPWHVRNVGPHWNNPAITNWDICWSADGERVAEHVYEEADARLIAAAPDLLAVAEAVASNLILCETEVGRMAQAAIAKATGGAA